jgi:hypothetical protein
MRTILQSIFIAQIVYAADVGSESASVMTSRFGNKATLLTLHRDGVTASQMVGDRSETPSGLGLSLASVTEEEQGFYIESWYGWQIMLADLGAIGALVGGGAATAESSGWAFIPIAGGAGYFAGGPLVHLAHGNGDRAAKSLLWRILAPTIGAAFGAGLAAGLTTGKPSGSECPRACGIELAAVFGFGAGMLPAMFIDWASAREALLVTPSSADGRLSWAPVLALGPRGKGAGVVVRF